jgi:hypothetical protein
VRAYSEISSIDRIHQSAILLLSFLLYPSFLFTLLLPPAKWEHQAFTAGRITLAASWGWGRSQNFDR